MDNINTEAIFYSGSSTTKGGHKVTLQVSERETIEILEAIGAGKRYMMALVPLTDGDQPDEVPKRKLADMKLSQRAGMLCSDNRFWEFMSLDGWPYAFVVYSDDSAARAVRDLCRVESRSELDTNPEAAERFKRLLTDFDVFTGRISAP